MKTGHARSCYEMFGDWKVHWRFDLWLLDKHALRNPKAHSNQIGVLLYGYVGDTQRPIMNLHLGRLNA